jgi:hypothetical protein
LQATKSNFHDEKLLSINCSVNSAPLAKKPLPEFYGAKLSPGYPKIPDFAGSGAASLRIS